MLVEAVDGLDGGGVAVVGREEQEGIALLHGEGLDLFGEMTVIAKARGDTEDEEPFGIVVEQALLVIIHDGISVAEERLTDINGVAGFGTRRCIDTVLIARQNNQTGSDQYEQTQKQTTRTMMRTA